MLSLQAAVLLAPPIVGLDRHADLLAHLGYGLAQRKEDLRLAELADDLLGAVSFLGHELAPLVKPAAISTSQPDSFKRLCSESRG